MTTLTQFLGVDVLTIVPGRPGRRPEPWTRQTYRSDAPSGSWTETIIAQRPHTHIDLTFTTVHRSQWAALQTFLATRRGRAVPFWCPSFQVQMRATNSALGTLTVVSAGYPAQFANDPWRKYLIAYAGGGLQMAVKVTAATAGSPTDTITWDTTGSQAGDYAAIAGLGAAAANNVVAAALIYARLDTDSVRTVWKTQEYSTVMLTAVELPYETP